MMWIRLSIQTSAASRSEYPSSLVSHPNMAGPPSTFNFESQSFITTYLCPNPQCRITFRSGSEVQYHLSNTNIECGQWVWGPPQDEEDEDDGEYCSYTYPISTEYMY